MPSRPPAKTRELAFLAGDGEMAQLMRNHDWSTSALGDPRTWPQALRICVRLMLNTRHPLFLFWGPDAICLYNDGYRAILGRERHAIALGNKGAVVWEEIWDVLGPQVEQVICGGDATWYENHLIPLTRDGALQDAYWTYSYSPIDDDTAADGVGGVLVIVTETTETVLAERQAKLEGRRFAQLFEQAPTFMTMLRGPDHVFEFCNPGYAQLIGHRDVVGKSVAQAIPEAVAQGFVALLDDVYTSARPFSAQGMKILLQRVPDGVLEERYLDFVYQPILEDDGTASGVFVEGVDVTERHYAELRGKALARLTDESRDLDDPGALAFAASKILGETLDASRVGFGTIDVESQSYTAQPAWTAPGLAVPPAHMDLRAFPAYIDKLNRGEIIRIDDVEADDLTRGNLPTLQARHAVAFINFPVIEKQGLVAILYVSNATVRKWSDDEIDLIREVAERTQGYIARLRGAARLAASEAEFRAFAQAMPNHVWASTPDGLLDWFNDRTYAYSGVDHGELDGTRWAGIVHPDDLSGSADAWSAALAAGKTYEFQFRLRRSDGAYRWHLARALPIRDADGAIIRWIGTNTDIEDQKASLDAYTALSATLEQKVRERTEERNVLAVVFESTDSFIHVLDLDYRWLAINKAGADEFARVFGPYPKVGDCLLDLLADQPTQYAGAKTIWARALAGEEYTAISEFGETDRVRNTYEMKFNSLYADDGRRIGAFQVVTNINERIAAQKQLLDTQEALRQSQKMEAVGQLTGGIAHDFNNMLAVIMGSLDLLKRRIGADDQRAAHYVNAAVEGAKRAANLTQRLLAFSRQQPLQPETFNLNKLVAGMSELMSHALGSAVQLETVLAGGLWSVSADANQLENVILNLGVNARDAMLDGGKLTIETQNAHLDERYVANEPGLTPGQYVMLAVTDTGTGMPPDVIAKAFDPFFTTKEVGKGTGLGLSQVYGFVKQSGGHVKIYSEPGDGTSIKIYLPRYLATGDGPAEVETESRAVLGEQQEVILVVDDEAFVREFSVAALTELGYRVLEADGAVNALRMIDAHPEIALLFTDIVMPETNGKKLADQVALRRPDIRVLYTTGYTRNAVVHNGTVDQGVELIGKPYTIDELAAKVRSVLDMA